MRGHHLPSFEIVSDNEQLSFLPQSTETNRLRYRGLEQQHELSASALQQWKAAILDFQRRVRATPTTQGTLFDLPPAHADPEGIDPFTLKRSNLRFAEWPESHNANDPVIYFVFDDAVPLLLYVGQAVKATQRWEGPHDCKEYVAQYLSANYRHSQQSAVCISFWWDTPAQFKPRLQLEAQLISKWRSPFNKENRRYWGTPFTDIR